MKTSQGGLLRLIALFKLLKAATLIVVGVIALKLVHTGETEELIHWIRRLGLDPAGPHLGRMLARLTNMSPGRFRDVGLGSFVYAALFLIEGMGLWLKKRWAEWFTVLITGSLVPLELYEIHRHPTPAKFGVLLLNIAIVTYLIVRLSKETTEARLK